MTDVTEATACDIRASLLLADFDCDPDTITAHLGLAPARVARRGGGNVIAAWWTGARTGRNEWLFETPVVRTGARSASVALGDVLRPLHRMLAARRDALATLPPCTGEIRIEMSPQGAKPELAIAADDLAFLADLGLSISIDVRIAEAAA